MGRFGMFWEGWNVSGYFDFVLGPFKTFWYVSLCFEGVLTFWDVIWTFWDTIDCGVSDHHKASLEPIIFAGPKRGQLSPGFSIFIRSDRPTDRLTDRPRLVCLLRSNFSPYTFIKEQRDKGTNGPRDRGTKGQKKENTGT